MALLDCLHCFLRAQGHCAATRPLGPHMPPWRDWRDSFTAAALLLQLLPSHMIFYILGLRLQLFFLANKSNWSETQSKTRADQARVKSLNRLCDKWDLNPRPTGRKTITPEYSNIYLVLQFTKSSLVKTWLQNINTTEHLIGLMIYLKVIREPLQEFAWQT